MNRRKDGRWQQSFTIKGKRIYFYSTETTERKAMLDIQKQLIAFEEKEAAGKTFVEIADSWDTKYRETIPDTTYNKCVKAAYNRIVDYYNDCYAKDITSRHVDVFLHSLKFGQKTVAWHKCILNMIFDYAILNDLLKDNPVTHVRLPKGLSKGKREIPPTDALKTISEHHEGFDLLPFFLLYTGCRKSEALAIRREDIDFKNNIIKIRNHVIHDGNKAVFEPVLKTEAAHREIILLDRLKAVIPKNFEGFLFSMRNDGIEPLTKKAYDKRWNKYCKDYSINITAHQLRHGYATMLFEAGIDVKDAQDLMGHSDINLTKSVYTHIRDTRKEQTAAKLNTFKF